MSAKKWTSNKYTPRRKCWYITRTESGDVQWRAWGNGAWWKQIKGGWLEWYDGIGNAITYDYVSASRQPIEKDSNEFPQIT